MQRPTVLPTLLIASVVLCGCADLPKSAPLGMDTTREPRPEIVKVARHTEIPAESANAPPLEGHPITSVVVTQCNLVVAVYMTMPDGRLLRYDKSAEVPVDELLQMAYSASRSERVEVSCNDDSGLVGYEKHDPV